MSMLVVLRDHSPATDLDPSAVQSARLGGLGVTEATVLRGDSTYALVVQGWLLDPAIEEVAAALFMSATPGAGVRILRPVVHLVVSPTGGGPS